MVMAVFMILVVSVFAITFFSVCFYECTHSRAAGGREAEGLIFGSEGPSRRGLDRAVIETFPILTYSAVKGLKIGKGSLECAVCLSGFEDDDKLRLLPKCNHVFHTDCIDQWLASNATCPVCRAMLYPDANGVDVSVLLQSSESRNESTGQNPTSLRTEEQNHVAINVEELQSRDRVQAVQIANRPTAGKRMPGTISRSHSTGHSLVKSNEIQENTDTDRFTLRLPEEVRKQVLDRCGKLKPSSNNGAVLVRIQSARVGYRTAGRGGVLWE